MIRFFNGRTLTMAHGVTVTTDEVWTDGDKIAYVGPTPETLPAFEREIDLGGDLVMPGFKNAHAHAGMSFVRSYADDVPLQPWLFEQIFPLEAKLTPEAVYAFTKLSILEYLTSGITAGFDMYYFRDAIAQAGIDCGFRTVLCGGGGSAQQLEAEYRRFNALHPLVSYQLGLHSEYTSSLAASLRARCARRCSRTTPRPRAKWPSAASAGARRRRSCSRALATSISAAAAFTACT